MNLAACDCMHAPLHYPSAPSLSSRRDSLRGMGLARCANPTPNEMFSCVLESINAGLRVWREPAVAGKHDNKCSQIATLSEANMAHQKTNQVICPLCGTEFGTRAEHAEHRKI